LWVWTPPRWDVLDTTLCDKVCHWLAIGRWFSLGIPVSSTNKTDHHDITEILLKVALSTISQPLNFIKVWRLSYYNMIKFMSLTRSPLLIYHGVWNLRKTLLHVLASDLMSWIYIDMINTVTCIFFFSHSDYS